METTPGVVPPIFRPVFGSALEALEMFLRDECPVRSSGALFPPQRWAAVSSMSPRNDHSTSASSSILFDGRSARGRRFCRPRAAILYSSHAFVPDT